MTDIDDEEWTEAHDATIPETHLVGMAANGVDQWLVMKQDAAGLLDADYVRGLIAKSEPETQETVTMSGSPAAIAALIHGAPVRKATPEPAAAEDDVAKAEESAATQNDLPDSAFAYIESGGTKDERGRTVPRSLRHFNIHDAAHVRNALSRAPQSPFGDKAMPKIRSAAKRFGVDVSKAEQAAPETNEVSKDMDGSAGMPLDEGMDGMDPTVVLAAPEDDAPGDPSDPGSPAWEAIDAATARKWTAILARSRTAIGVMADREMLEAASADPDDAENAFDLQDASCAIDYVISVLAPFAIDEQAESDEGSMAMEMSIIGKALDGFDPAPLELVEAYGPIAKSGRALSAANESAIRAALQSLQNILASLPKAPDAPAPAAGAAMTKEAGQPVAKTANEEPDMPQTTTAEDATAASGQAPAMGSASPDPQPVAGTAVTDVAKAEATPETATLGQEQFAELVKQLAAALNSRPAEPEPVAKAEDTSAAETAATADEPVTKTEQAATIEPAATVEPTGEQSVAKAAKPPQVAIYDEGGHLVGTVDPAEITMLSPAQAPAGDSAAKADDATPEAPAAPAAEAPATPPTDLAPQPPAAAGVPAAVPTDDAMTKQAANGQPDSNTATLESSSPIDILKQAFADHSATQGELIATQMADVRKGLEDKNAALEEVVKQLQTQIEERITRIENAPPIYAIASNGAMPDPRHLRGQNQGALAVDPAIGPMLKARLANSVDAVEQKAIQDEMTTAAGALFQQMQAGARQR
jgi:hypothetical protein